MSFKLLFPTYLARYRWVERTLAEMASTQRLGRILHLGTGEGDYDPMLTRFADQVDACDINPDDIELARARNASVDRLRYWVQDGHALDFPDAHFDAVVSVDVIEHVADPALLVREIARVLKPGGRVVITAPNVDFPWTYDPLHRALSRSRKILGIGAYAYGHDRLISEDEMRGWLDDAGLDPDPAARITHALAATLECYWPGVLQRVLKANSTNNGKSSNGAKRRFVVKPRSTREPMLIRATELLNRVDSTLARPGAPSVGIAFVATRR